MRMYILYIYIYTQIYIFFIYEHVHIYLYWGYTSQNSSLHRMITSYLKSFQINLYFSVLLGTGVTQNPRRWIAVSNPVSREIMDNR